MLVTATSWFRSGRAAPPRAMRLAAALVGMLIVEVVWIGGAQAQVVAFGSSSTYGQGVARDEAYPAKLEAALRARGVNVSVVNAGLSGDTTAGGVSRVDSAVPAGTKVAIVELGVNDRYAGIDPATTRANLTTIVNRIKSRGAKVLLCSYRGDGGLVAQVAGATGSRFMQFGTPKLNDDKFRVQGDPQAAKRGYGHFNGAGYDDIVSHMLPQVQALLR